MIQNIICELTYKKIQVIFNHFDDFKAFIKYSNDMDDIYKNNEEHNPNKKRKILIAFNMTADMLSNKKLTLIVTELFIRGKKLNISLVSITQSYFSVPKTIRVNSMHYLIMKIPNKEELQQSAFNHFSDIKCTAKPYSFLVINCTLVSDNLFHFRMNLLERI